MGQLGPHLQPGATAAGNYDVGTVPADQMLRARVPGLLAGIRAGAARSARSNILPDSAASAGSTR